MKGDAITKAMNVSSIDAVMMPVQQESASRYLLTTRTTANERSGTGAWG